MIEILDSEKELTDSDIQLFEAKYDLSLPANLKKLVRKYNGGYTEDSDEIDKFLSIKYGKVRIELIIDTHQITEKNIPEGYLPFALDWSNNALTISLEGENEGKIVKFYFDTNEDSEIIADSLEELLGVESIDDL
jgi:cell wall assembly regulator SMI1